MAFVILALDEETKMGAVYRASNLDVHPETMVGPEGGPPQLVIDLLPDPPQGRRMVSFASDTDIDANEIRNLLGPAPAAFMVNEAWVDHAWDDFMDVIDGDDLRMTPWANLPPMMRLTLMSAMGDAIGNSTVPEAIGDAICQVARRWAEEKDDPPRTCPQCGTPFTRYERKLVSTPISELGYPRWANETQETLDEDSDPSYLECERGHRYLFNGWEDDMLNVSEPLQPMAEGA